MPTNIERAAQRLFAAAPAACGLLLALASPAAAGGSSDIVDPYVDGLLRALEAPAPAARPITLAEAIRAAVENNPGVRAQRQRPRQDRLLPLTAASAYDPTLRLETSVADSTTPTANVLSGVTVGGNQSLEQDEVLANLTLSKLFVTGTAVDLSWENSRRSSNSSFQSLSPEYEPIVGLTVQQPLLKNFGGLTTRTAVRMAANDARRSAALFEAGLADFAAEVVDAYWNYSEAQAEVEVRRHALELAGELVAEAEARVKIGTLPPVASREARADEALRKEAAISAQNRLDVAARTLQYTVMLSDRPGGPPLPLRPVDRHQVEERKLDRASVLRRAVERRAEVRAARLEVDTARLEQTQARNELLPSLNLVGNYRLLGLGGISRPAELPSGSGDVASATLSSGEKDAYGDALDLLASGDFYSYSVGLQLELPFSNARARAEHERATIALRSSEERLRQVLSDIALEIERVIGDVASATQRVFAARMARELAEENLDNQKRRYEVGMVTTTDVLRFQDKVVAAMASEVRAVADHARALAQLHRAEGTLLDAYDVSVESGDGGRLPWWARY